MIELDAEGEAFVFDQHWEIAIPVSMELPDGGEPRIEVFPRAEKTVREYESRFFDDLLSDQALEWLWSALAPEAASWGYRDDRFRGNWGYVTRFSSRPAAGRLQARILYQCPAPENLTTLDLDYCLGQGHAAAVICEEGRVVSAALTHTAIGDGSPCEIGVETIPAARGREYASSCAAALAKFLTERGLTAEYRFQRRNAASRRVAEKAGFVRTGRFYSYVLRRITKPGKSAKPDDISRRSAPAKD